MIAMEQNSLFRSASRIASALLAVLFLPPLLRAAEPDAGDGTKGRETPQALVATYNDAVARKDWKTCYSCYDAKKRADLFGPLFHGIGMSRDETLKAIVKKHVGDKLPGADEIAIPAVRPDTRMAKELRMFEKLQKQFRDLPAFIDELSSRLDAMGQEPFPKIYDVRDIKIEGDVAVGHGRLDLPPPADMLQPIHFCKIDGRWYLTIPDPPPPLSVKERAAILEAEVETIYIWLCCNGNLASEEGKRYGQLSMRVRPYEYESNRPTLHLVRLSPAQAKKLIDYLATEGFLQQAAELDKQEIPDRVPSDFWYTLQVSTRSIQLHEDLDWGPKLVKRLEGLRGALDGEAAQAIDAILAGLVEERKKEE